MLICFKWFKKTSNIKIYIQYNNSPGSVIIGNQQCFLHCLGTPSLSRKFMNLHWSSFGLNPLGVRPGCQGPAPGGYDTVLISQKNTAESSTISVYGVTLCSIEDLDTARRRGLLISCHQIGDPWRKALVKRGGIL